MRGACDHRSRAQRIPFLCDNLVAQIIERSDGSKRESRSHIFCILPFQFFDLHAIANVRVLAEYLGSHFSVVVDYFHSSCQNHAQYVGV
jgi:hypothetical protein